MMSAAELVARKYEADGPEVVRTYQHLRFDKHLRLMRDCMDLRSGTRVLDVGCGTGALLVELARGGAKVTGLDTFEEADGIDRLIAEARLREDVVCAPLVKGNASSLPFATDSFDLVISIGMLEHIAPSARPQVLQEIFRVISPGGRLMLIAGPTKLTPFDQHLPGYPFANWLSRESKVAISQRAGRRQFLAIPWGISRRELHDALPDAEFASLYAKFFGLDGGQLLGPFRPSPIWVLAWLKRRLQLHFVFEFLAHALYFLGQEHCHILSVRKPAGPSA